MSHRTGFTRHLRSLFNSPFELQSAPHTRLQPSQSSHVLSQTSPLCSSSRSICLNASYLKSPQYRRLSIQSTNLSTCNLTPLTSAPICNSRRPKSPASILTTATRSNTGYSPYKTQTRSKKPPNVLYYQDVEINGKFYPKDAKFAQLIATLSPYMEKINPNPIMTSIALCCLTPVVYYNLDPGAKENVDYWLHVLSCRDDIFHFATQSLNDEIGHPYFTHIMVSPTDLRQVVLAQKDLQTALSPIPDPTFPHIEIADPIEYLIYQIKREQTKCLRDISYISAQSTRLIAQLDKLIHLIAQHPLITAQPPLLPVEPVLTPDPSSNSSTPEYILTQPCLSKIFIPLHILDKYRGSNGKNEKSGANHKITSQLDYITYNKLIDQLNDLLFAIKRYKVALEALKLEGMIHQSDCVEKVFTTPLSSPFQQFIGRYLLRSHHAGNNLMDFDEVVGFSQKVGDLYRDRIAPSLRHCESTRHEIHNQVLVPLSQCLYSVDTSYLSEDSWVEGEELY